MFPLFVGNTTFWTEIILRYNECRVYFALYGDSFDPEEMTRFLGLSPTSIERRGEKVSRYALKFSSWNLSTDNVSRQHIDVYEMASEIVSQLEPKRALILEAVRKFSVFSKLQVVLSVSVEDEISMPSIGFDADTIRFLGEIGAFIDIDTYKHQS